MTMHRFRARSRRGRSALLSPLPGLLAALAVAALAGCGTAPARSGRPPLSDNRPHIMSMNPCIDAVLLNVADADQIVAVSHYSHDPRSASADIRVARRYPAVFDTAEEAIAMRPDIILLGPHVAPATQHAIRSSGIRIISLAVPATVEESIAQVKVIAAAAGHAARGDALAQRIRMALTAARPAAGVPPVNALIRQGGGLVPGDGTLADELLTRTGFHNMASAFGLAQWDILPLERLAMDPPRLVLTDLDTGGDAPPLPMRTVAIAHFPGHLLQCAGPNLIDAAQRLATIRRGLVGG